MLRTPSISRSQFCGRGLRLRFACQKECRNFVRLKFTEDWSTFFRQSSQSYFGARSVKVREGDWLPEDQMLCTIRLLVLLIQPVSRERTKLLPANERRLEASFQRPCTQCEFLETCSERNIFGYLISIPDCDMCCVIIPPAGLSILLTPLFPFGLDTCAVWTWDVFQWKTANSALEYCIWLILQAAGSSSNSNPIIRASRGFFCKLSLCMHVCKHLDIQDLDALSFAVLYRNLVCMRLMLMRTSRHMRGRVPYMIQRGPSPGGRLPRERECKGGRVDKTAVPVMYFNLHETAVCARGAIRFDCGMEVGVADTILCDGDPINKTRKPWSCCLLLTQHRAPR
ncbi:hypothetical protein SELMODRAFT_439997 [Selaginella moellendorffii]|uniref:Uncharacterized protein n=1 Tax=Selaginella moellendorffii TaxID=88036 RepID=D8R8S1_SELML|nr:hypothetical protein SELMODRAFT_439997 [Selaginella moellendorffii]